MGVDFRNFYRFICSEILESHGNLDSYKRSDQVIVQLPIDPISDDEVKDLARIIVTAPNVLHYFLIDVRDWDAFRLLMRRHNAALCVVPIEDEPSSSSSPKKGVLKKGLEFLAGKEGIDYRHRRSYTLRPFIDSSAKTGTSELRLPRVFLRSTREISLEAKVSELESLLAQRKTRWDEERRQLLREFENLQKSTKSASNALKENLEMSTSTSFQEKLDLAEASSSASSSNGSTSSATAGKDAQLAPTKSILRRRASSAEHNHKENTAGSGQSPQRKIKWDDSVTSLEAERQRKLRIEATFMSIYQSQRAEKEAKDEADELDEAESDEEDEADGPEADTKETPDAAKSAHDENLFLKSTGELFSNSLASSTTKDRELGHKRSAELVNETSLVSVKSIKSLYEGAPAGEESNVSEKSGDQTIPLASGRRRRPEQVAASEESPVSPLPEIVENPLEKNVEAVKVVRIDSVGSHKSEKVIVKSVSDETLEESTTEENTVADDESEDPAAKKDKVLDSYIEEIVAAVEDAEEKKTQDPVVIVEESETVIESTDNDPKKKSSLARKIRRSRSLSILLQRPVPLDDNVEREEKSRSSIQSQLKKIFRITKE